MTYPDKDQKKIQQTAITLIQKNPITFRRFIRNYAQFILDQKKKIYMKVKKMYNIPDNVLNQDGFVVPKDGNDYNSRLIIYERAIRDNLIKLIKKYT